MNKRIKKKHSPETIEKKFSIPKYKLIDVSFYVNKFEHPLIDKKAEELRRNIEDIIKGADNFE